MKKMKLSLLALLVGLALLLMPMVVRADAYDENNEYTVFVTFEGFNLGHGFYVEPVAVTLPAGATAWDATVAALEYAGLAFEMTDWGGLDRIFGIHPGVTTPSVFITIELEAGADDGSVGSFDYSEYAGWMFSVNHYMLPVGADAFYVADGDVIRWIFSVQGWGADLGIDEDRGFWTTPLFEAADVTEIIRMLFTVEMTEADRQIILDEIIEPRFSLQEINETVTIETTETVEVRVEYEPEVETPPVAEEPPAVEPPAAAEPPVVETPPVIPPPVPFTPIVEVIIPEPTTHTVQSGDTLYALARRYLGNAAYWPRIFEANRHQIRNANMIFIGQVLEIPAVD